MSRFTAVLIGCMATPALVQAEAPEIAAAAVDATNARKIVLTFNTPQPVAVVFNARFWTVVFATDADARQEEPAAIDIEACAGGPPIAGTCPPGQDIAQLALLAPRDAPANLKAIEVFYHGTAGAGRQIFEIAAGPSGPLAGAKKDDADISFTGSYARVVEGEGKYDIDTFAGYMRRVGSRPGAGRAGFYAQAKTKDSDTADPQSFAVHAVWQRVVGGGGFAGPVQSPFVNARAGLEFDKDGEQRNVVISPVVTLPFRAGRGTLGMIQPGLTSPHGTIHAGVEVVKPRTSAFGELAWRTRGLVGSTFVVGYQPERSGFYSVLAKAAYQVRFLSAPEPYKDPRRGPVDPATGERGDPVLELGSQPRHQAEAAFEYFPAKWTAVEIKYEYGSLPPAFVVTDHTVTLGLKFTLKQTSYGRYSILKP